MYPRVNYEMTEEDLKDLQEAMRPVPMIMLQCGMPPSPQENANRAWQRLGEKMGFEWDTVNPIDGKGARFFTAIPSETGTQKKERFKNEVEEKKKTEVKRIKMENQELLTIEEMASRLKVKRSWIYFRTMQTGNNSIPRVKIGKYLRFNPGAVMEWIEAQYNGEAVK